MMRKKSVVAFGALIATAYAAPALAQEASTGAAQDVESASGDIIVTARRSEERLQDVPISISVLNQKQIENRNLVNAQDLATFTPALSTNPGFGSINSSFSIRGFVQAVNTPPSVGVYFADVVAPRGASANISSGDGAGPGSFFDLQNVQVLKGPQGTLFGRNTTGGAILLVPQKPTSNLEGYVQGSYGNYNMYRGQGVLNIPLSETFRFRLSVDRQARDGYMKNDTGIGPKRFSDINYLSVRASVVADLTPDLENYTIATYSHNDTNGDVQKTLVANPNYQLGGLAALQLAKAAAAGNDFYTLQSTQFAPRTLQNQWQIINTTTWRASDTLTVKNIISYAELKLNLRNPIFGTNLDLSALGYPAGTYVDFATSNPIPGRNTADQSTFTEEFRLQGESLGGKLSWQTGAYLEVSNPLRQAGSQSPVLLQCSTYDTFACNNPLGSGTVQLTQSGTAFRNVGLYAQATYSLTDKLKLTGGFRYTWDRTHSEGMGITYIYPQIPFASTPITAACLNTTQTYPACDLNYTQKSRAPTWVIGLDYKPTEDTLVYAKYSRGYRTGGVAVGAPPAIAAFEPEKVDTYEGGFKLSFPDALHARLNVSGYYNKFSNQQLALGLLSADGTSAPLAGIVNAGKSRIYGGEVEASIQPFAGFTIDASYAYVNARIQKITPPDLGGSRFVLAPGQIADGNELPYTPKNQYSITGTYELPLDDSIGRVALSATFVHVDKARISYDHALFNVPAFYDYNPAKNLLSLNVSWDKVANSPFDLQFFMTNVTGKKYYSYINDLISGTGFETGFVGEPRMFGGRIRYNFGG